MSTLPQRGDTIKIHDRGMTVITHVDVENHIITVDYLPEGTKRGDKVTVSEWKNLTRRDLK